MAVTKVIARHGRLRPAVRSMARAMVPALCCLAVWTARAEPAPVSELPLPSPIAPAHPVVDPVTAPQGGTFATGGQGSLLRLTARIQTMERELRDLRGQLEESNNALEGVRRRQRELYLDLDRRLQRLEQGASAGPIASVPGADQPVVEAAGQISATGPLVSGEGVVEPGTGTAAPLGAAKVAKTASEQQRMAYQAALDLLKAGRYPQSIAAFGQFLATYPDSALAPNAQYWIGEAYYVTRDFDQALKAFQQVVQKYPASSKSADALVKVGYIQYEKKDWAASRASLRTVMARWPTSAAARLAQNRLQRMVAEGH